MISTSAAQQSLGFTPIHTAQKTDPETQGTPQPLTTTPEQTTATVQTPPAVTLQQLKADQQNLYTLVDHLREINTPSDGQPVTPVKISDSLNSEIVVPYLGSTYALKRTNPPTLADVITDLGHELPRTAEDVSALSKILQQKASLPLLGNLGGGLSWPMPMPQEDQNKIISFLRSGNTGLPDFPPPPRSSGMRSYLLSGSSVTHADLQHPETVLQKALDSPRGRALGQAIQTHLNGAPSDTSIYDYALTAIQLQLDPESITAPGRNKLAGFDLAHSGQWGYSPEVIVDSLRQYLVSRNLATKETSQFAAHLLLSRVAPQFLIKDIPAHVKVGGMAWANLSIAAAAIEAERPGSVSGMNFEQVMTSPKSGEGKSSAMEYAQANALVDWGVANGELTKNIDDTYTAEQLNTVRAEFNKQLEDQLSASQSLDKAIPTRRELALAKLKERFGDLGPLFEKQTLGTDQYRGTAQQTGLVGLHSLLDIAMMDLPNPRPFVSTDPAFPARTLEALNSNLVFGVQTQFEEQFNSAITEKKAAVNASVRHLISQLPFTDRKNFEYGKVSFFQNDSYTLGTGFADTTPGPKMPGLIVKTELNGISQAYEINFNKGTIEPTNLSRARIGESRQANRVTTTKAFTPADTAHDHDHERAVNDTPFNSFNSQRSHSIAAVFTQHLELDDPAIKQQAYGQTRLDQLQGGPKPLNEFLLNLIPFRSAIVNVQQGNYGEAALDFTLDIFGFLTAGAAKAGKLLKIGSSSLSSGAKTLRAAKVLGAAFIGELNPASGLGDLAVGGIKLLNKGGRAGLNKAREAVNKLRGKTGNYDLLRAANKENGPTLIGSYTVGADRIEGAAVLKNDQWYNYDPLRNRPYGSPIEQFTPLNDGLFDSVVEDNLVRFSDNITNARTPTKISRFNQGYQHGELNTLPGYTGQTSFKDLVALAANRHRPPEEIGVLARVIKEKRIADGKYFTALLASDVGRPGVSLERFAQGEYLARVDLTSRGDCAGMVSAMALALHRGDEKIFLENLRRASNTASPTPLHSKFNDDMKKLQDAVDQKHTFHINNAPSLMSYQRIIDDLSRSTLSRYLRISTEDHALLAGVKIREGKKEWFFFDPNSGLVKFDNVKSMQAGLEKVLNSGSISATLNPKISPQGKREFHVSPFYPDDIVTDRIDSFAVSIMVSTPLPP